MYDEREVIVDRLQTAETRELAHRLMQSSGVDETAAEDVVTESAGRPFLVYELIEHLKETGAGYVGGQELKLTKVLWRRISSLSEEKRKLLEVVAIAGQPIRIADACMVAGIETGDHAVLQTLRTGRLIRGTSGESQEIEVYHDRVRQSVLKHLTPAVREAHHLNLAEMYAKSGSKDAEVMAYHLNCGGKPEQAATRYKTAAGAAATLLAFGHAAELYRQALKCGIWSAEEEHNLRSDLGLALANAGRGKEAAQEYLRAAEDNPAGAIDLKHQAAMALLTSGHVDEGLSCLVPVMSSIRLTLARTPWQALVSLLARRLQLVLRGTDFIAREEAAIDCTVKRRIDIGWSVVIGLSVVDPIRGADFQTRSLLLALQAGEPFRITRALAIEAGHLASSGSIKQATKTLHQAEALAAKLGRPYARGIVELSSGTVAYFEGKWKQSFGCCQKAIGTFRECPGTIWEIDTANAFSLWSLAKLGEIRELGRISPALLKDAHERGDLYAIANLSTQIMAMVRLGADDPDGARIELNEVMGRWSQNGYHVQHHDALLAFVPIELYCGDPEAAWRRVQSEWSAFRWSLLSHVQDLRVEMLQMRAYCALAMASAAGDRDKFLRAARRDAGRLRGEKLPWTFALADYIAGAVAYLENDLTAARKYLECAIAGFDRIDAQLHASVTRKRLAQIREDGATGVDDLSDEWFRREEIRMPGRMMAAFAPGFPTVGSHNPRGLQG
jgi:tetratricopeptide (TPR) repeat protein